MIKLIKFLGHRFRKCLIRVDDGDMMMRRRMMRY
jgi:hypothetical protein